MQYVNKKITVKLFKRLRHGIFINEIQREIIIVNKINTTRNLQEHIVVVFVEFIYCILTGSLY